MQYTKVLQSLLVAAVSCLTPTLQFQFLSELRWQGMQPLLLLVGKGCGNQWMLEGKVIGGAGSSNIMSAAEN